MNQNTLVLAYSALLHVVGLISMVVLVAINAVPSSEGLPIIGGLLGIGVGAGVALVVPGGTLPPSQSPAQTPASGGATPALPPPSGAVAPGEGGTAPLVAGQPG